MTFRRRWNARLPATSRRGEQLVRANGYPRFGRRRAIANANMLLVAAQPQTTAGAEATGFRSGTQRLRAEMKISDGLSVQSTS